MRKRNRRDAYRKYWWRLAEPRPGMWRALEGLSALHRDADGSPSTGCSAGATRASAPTPQLIVIARDDDTTFGILHSRFHELWSLRLGTSLEGHRPSLHAEHDPRDVPVPGRA